MSGQGRRSLAASPPVGTRWGAVWVCEGEGQVRITVADEFFASGPCTVDVVQTVESPRGDSAAHPGEVELAASAKARWKVMVFTVLDQQA